MHSTRPFVRLVPMEYHLFHWYSIGQMHLITGTSIISVGFRLSRSAFYSSIGMIGTNGISFIPLVIYIVFSVCLGSHSLELRIYILFSLV